MKNKLLAKRRAQVTRGMKRAGEASTSEKSKKARKNSTLAVDTANAAASTPPPALQGKGAMETDTAIETLPATAPASLAQPATVVGGDADEMMHSNEEEKTQNETSFPDPFGDDSSQPPVDVSDNIEASTTAVEALPASDAAPQEEAAMEVDPPASMVENIPPSSVPAPQEETAMEIVAQPSVTTTLALKSYPQGEDLTAASKLVTSHEGNNNQKEFIMYALEKDQDGVIVATHKATFKALKALTTKAMSALDNASRQYSPNMFLLNKQAIQDSVLKALVNFQGDENTKLEPMNPFYFSCYDSEKNEMIHVFRTNDMRLVPDNAPPDFIRLDKTGSKHIALFVVIIQKFSDVDKKKKPVGGNFISHTSEENFAKEKPESGWFIAPHDPTNKHFSPILAMDTFESVFGTRFIVRFPGAQQSDPLKHKKLLLNVHKFVEEDDLLKFLVSFVLFYYCLAGMLIPIL